MTGAGRDPVAIALLYPELLGTYGDGGNASVLARRLEWRGLTATTVEVGVGDPVPSACDLYLMGGGEDGPQVLAARELRSGGALRSAVDGGAAVLAVCAGFQVLGRSFAGPGTTSHEGLGLLDAVTRRGEGPRRVGEILVEPDPALGLPVLTGYENHGCVTALGPEARPLGRVLVGHGNDAPEGAGGTPLSTESAGGTPCSAEGAGGATRSTEGAVQGRVLGTYLHGPVLARNPALADLLLSWVVGPLPALDDEEVEILRRERVAAASRPAGGLARWRRRRR